MIDQARTEAGALRACPYCGGEAVLWRGSTGHWATCAACGADGPEGAFDEAIAAWNRRAGEAELVAALRDVDKLWKQGILAMHENEIDRIHGAVRALLAKHGA